MLSFLYSHLLSVMMNALVALALESDALRILERSGLIEQAALTKIFRQQIAALREAVNDLAAGRSERGFNRLEEFWGHPRKSRRKTTG